MMYLYYEGRNLVLNKKKIMRTVEWAERAELNHRCPRCYSKRSLVRLDGSKTCSNCGQRWNSDEIIKSFDKRKLKKNK